MKREELTRVLSRAATAAGYVFHTGEAHLMNGIIRIYPAAWLEPPVLKSSEGRREGDFVYRVTMHVMSLSSAGSKTEELWTGLEEDAIAVVKHLEADPAIIEIANVSCTPARQSLTAHGETSVTLVCDVKMWYYI